MALFFDFLASLALDKKLLTGNVILLNLFLELVLLCSQLFDVLLAASDLLVKLAQAACRILHSMPILVESPLSLAHKVYDLIEFVLQATIIVASDFHDLGLLLLELSFELLNFGA